MSVSLTDLVEQVNQVPLSHTWWGICNANLLISIMNNSHLYHTHTYIHTDRSTLILSMTKLHRYRCEAKTKRKTSETFDEITTQTRVYLSAVVFYNFIGRCRSQHKKHGINTMKYVPCVCASVCKHVQINDSEKSGLKNAQNEYAKCEGEAWDRKWVKLWFRSACWQSSFTIVFNYYCACLAHCCAQQLIMMAFRAAHEPSYD